MSGRLIALLCLCLAAVAWPGAAGADTFSSTVFINIAYRNDCTFTFALEGNVEADSAGVATATIPPGPYQLSISTPLPDNMWNSAICTEADFSLAGPGVSYSSYLGGNLPPYGVTMNIVLQPASTYTMVDATHPSQPVVITTAATGSSSSLLPTTPIAPALPITITRQTDLVGSLSASAKPAFRGTLDATVASSGRIRASYGGAPLGSLKAGRYTLVFSDHFSGGAVELRRSGGGSHTLARDRFQGSRGVSVTLSAGHWTLEDSGAQAVRFVVSG